MSDYEEYDSGPFCKHFSDPSDCEECREEARVRDVYSERAELVAYLTRHHEWHWSYDEKTPEWPIICIHTREGQMSWHISQDDAHLFGAATTHNDWDGHSSEEKYDRLRRL